MGSLKLTKSQKQQIFDARVGYGIATYKSADNQICSFEFFIDGHNRMCYITNGKPATFEVRYDEDGCEWEAHHAMEELDNWGVKFDPEHNDDDARYLGLDLPTGGV